MLRIDTSSWQRRLLPSVVPRCPTKVTQTRGMPQIPQVTIVTLPPGHISTWGSAGPSCWPNLNSLHLSGGCWYHRLSWQSPGSLLAFTIAWFVLHLALYPLVREPIHEISEQQPAVNFGKCLHCRAKIPSPAAPSKVLLNYADSPSTGRGVGECSCGTVELLSTFIRATAFPSVPYTEKMPYLLQLLFRPAGCTCLQGLASC